MRPITRIDVAGESVIDEVRREGAALAAEIRRGSDGGGSMEAVSRRAAVMVREVTLGHLSDARLRAVPGGFVADLLFAGLPPGVPDVMGTPEAAPIPDRAEAIGVLVGIVADLELKALAEARAKPQPLSLRWFAYRGIGLGVPRAAFDGIGRVLDEAEVVAALGALDRDLGLAGGDPVGQPDEAAMARLVPLAVMALVAGIEAWPAKTPARGH